MLVLTRPATRLCTALDITSGVTTFTTGVNFTQTVGGAPSVSWSAPATPNLRVTKDGSSAKVFVC